MSWEDRFGFGVARGVGFGAPAPDLQTARRLLPSNYFSPVVEMPIGSTRTQLLNVNLDASIAPVWSIVLLAAPRGGVVAPSNPAMAIGLLNVNGGGGGGIPASPIPFDCHDCTILTVPAANINLSVDCSRARIADIPASRGDGVFSAYAVPGAFARAHAYYSEFTTTVGQNATVAFGFTDLRAAAQDATTVLFAADTVLAAIPYGQQYEVDIGNPALTFQGWRVQAPAAVATSIPLWLPRPAGSDGFTRVTNRSTGASARYVAVHRLKV